MLGGGDLKEKRRKRGQKIYACVARISGSSEVGGGFSEMVGSSGFGQFGIFSFSSALPRVCFPCVCVCV